MIKLKPLLKEGFREDQNARKFLNAALNNSTHIRGKQTFKFDSYKKLPNGNFKYINVSLQDMSNKWKSIGDITIHHDNYWKII